MQALGVGVSRTETHMNSTLPQYFADEFGWPEMVAQVAEVYHAMPAEERAKTAILAGNYGSAGAIDFFGPATACPHPSALTRIITIGDSANTPVRA